MLRVEPEIKAAYVATGQVSLAFSPMLDHGEASLLAHRTVECAGAQSPLGYWQMHDLLFERQGDLWQATPDLLSDWAAEIGLDRAALRACLDDPAITNKVTRMDEVRRAAGVRQRPSFDINGRLVEGALPFSGFEQVFGAASPR